MTPEQLAEQLGQQFLDELRTVVLYGSAAAGDFLPGVSNYNLLLLIEPLTSRELERLEPTIAAWSRAGNAPPLVFTPAELAASVDAFPIELLDIQQSRRVLWGEDLLAELRIEREHLRLQIERELTGKLLSLRSQYLLTGGKPKAVGDLMLRSLSTILVLLRAVLRLHQDQVPARKLDAMRELRKHLEFDIAPFEELFAARQRGVRPAAVPVSFGDYLRSIEQVVQAINQLSSRRSDA
jgi:predicted nucleotidyltransferase